MEYGTKIRNEPMMLSGFNQTIDRLVMENSVLACIEDGLNKGIRIRSRRTKGKKTEKYMDEAGLKSKHKGWFY